MKRHLDYALTVIKAIIELISVDLNFIKMDPLHWETGRRALLRAHQTIWALNKPGTLPFMYPASEQQPHPALPNHATGLPTSFLQHPGAQH